MSGGRSEVREAKPRRASNSSKMVAAFIFAVFFCIIPGVLIFFGVLALIRQENHIKTFLPVQAHVDSSAVTSHRGSRHGSTYSPAVTYEYEVDGTHYASNNVLIQESSTSDYGWAQDIVNKYRAGQTCEAYYNPQNPQDAFLVRARTFIPYAMILFPMVLLTVGLAIVLEAFGFLGTSNPEYVPEPDGWIRVCPNTSMASRRRGTLILSTWWYGVGVLTLGHYFSVAGADTSIPAYVTGAVYATLGLLVLVPAIRTSILLQEFFEPVVRIKSDPVKRGEIVPVEVLVQVKKEVRVKNVEIGIISKLRPNSSVPPHANWQTVPKNKTFSADNRFKVECSIMVPADPSPCLSLYRQSRGRGKITVKINLEQGTSFCSEYPIDVAD